MSDFNHIDKNLSKDTQKTIKEYFEVCKEGIWVCHKSRVAYRRKNLALRFMTGLLTATGIGTTAGLGPIGTPVLAGALFCIGFAEKMGWKEKCDKLRIVETEYSDLAEELKTYMRGTEVMDNVKFSTRLDYVERMKNKLCPSMTHTYEKYAELEYKPAKKVLRF